MCGPSFGSGQISVSKFMSSICSLLGDANSQVRSGAMETIVDIYRHVGVKVRIDLSKRGLPSARMGQLTARFDAVDATTGNHLHLSDNEVSYANTCTLLLSRLAVCMHRMTGRVSVQLAAVLVLAHMAQHDLLVPEIHHVLPV